MKSLQNIMKRSVAPYLVAAAASFLILITLYAVMRYAFIPLFVPLQTENYLYYINTNIFTVRDYAVKAVIFVAVTILLTVAAVKVSNRLTGEVASLKMPPLAYLEYWKENKRASAVLFILAYLALVVNAASAALIWFNAFQAYIATLHSSLLYSAAASIAFSVVLLLLPWLDDVAQLIDACKKLVGEVSEPPAKEDYRKVGLLTLFLHVMVTDAILRNIKQIERLNPQPYLATITLAMIHGKKNNVQKAKQAATRLLDQLAGGEYNLLLQTLTDAEKELPEIPKMAGKMELMLNEPAQFIYVPRTRRNIALKALLPIAAASTITILINILKWLLYFATG